MNKEDDNIIYLRPVVELDEEDRAQSGKYRKHWSYRKWLISALILVVAIVVGSLIYMQVTTYTTIIELKTFAGVSGANSNSSAFAKGIIRYGKDGATYMNYKGESIWNHPYEMNHPLLEISGNCAAIAEGGGNQIVVFDTMGMKGEIETTLPIEKISVSQQGIVAVLLKDQSTPKIRCYDAVGNILVDHKTSFTGTGYPTSLAMSQDGKTLLVTYLQATAEKITTNYAYYHFDDEELVQDNVIEQGTREQVVIPETKFINQDTSVMVSDQGIEIFQGSTQPKSIASIMVEEEIQQVFYGENQIGLLLHKGMNNENEIRIYDMSGKMVFSEQIRGLFTDIDIVNHQVVVYDKERCYIFNMYGTMKFNGEMQMELVGVYPIIGMNKYVVIGNEGMKEVRLAR